MKRSSEPIPSEETALVAFRDEFTPFNADVSDRDTLTPKDRDKLVAIGRSFETAVKAATLACRTYDDVDEHGLVKDRSVPDCIQMLPALMKRYIALTEGNRKETITAGAEVIETSTPAIRNPATRTDLAELGAKIIALTDQAIEAGRARYPRLLEAKSAMRATVDFWLQDPVWAAFARALCAIHDVGQGDLSRSEVVDMMNIRARHAKQTGYIAADSSAAPASRDFHIWQALVYETLTGHSFVRPTPATLRATTVSPLNAKATEPIRASAYRDDDDYQPFEPIDPRRKYEGDAA